MSERYPDITRDDAGVVLVNEWNVGTRDRQRAGADAVARLWRAGPLPEHALSLNLYVSDDGTSVLAYKQWTDLDAYREFARTARSAQAGEVAPGITRHEPTAYRLYRHGLGEKGAAPGSIVIVQFETRDGTAARTLVDTLFDVYGDEEPGKGAIGSHFHIAVDGSRMLNYAEFVDAASHEALITTETSGSRRLTSVLADVEGITPLGFRRYTLHTAVAR
ncbi:hypothetical protein [Actinomadura kijaniata]|uniref:hypothetical protein n=1 Tax=Actinomadura kijaniata TaxID=46161 RepID=UPI00082D0DEE|nr:hypothetical protein [Actinomadura kijaniata]